MKTKIEIDTNARFAVVQSEDKAIGLIYETRNYSKFHLSKYNREIDKAHARKLLTQLIKNPDITLAPILVDSDFNIVDGQHRFWGLKHADMPVPYILDKKITMADTITINGTQKQMRFMDYVNIWNERNYQDYSALLSEIRKYKSVATAATIAQMFFKDNSDKQISGNLSYKIRMGNFKFNYEQAQEIESFFDFVKQKSDQIGKKISNAAQTVIASFYFNSEINKTRLFSKLTPDLLEQLKNNAYSKKILADTYNHKLRKNAINYSFESKRGKDVFKFID